MSWYTLEQRWKILKIHLQNGESSTETVRKLPKFEN